MKKIFSLFICGFLSFSFGACAQMSREPIEEQTISFNDPNPKIGVYLADTVVEAPGHTGAGFFEKQNAANGVFGKGVSQGSLDVFSLDTSGASTHLTLRWLGKKIKNGAGIDFIVYENAFNYSGENDRFMELAVVEVSNDNVAYCGFNPNYTFSPETAYSKNPADWLRFAGKTPVLYNLSSNNLSAAELFKDDNADGAPDLGGGDGFDLDDLSDDNTFSIGCTTALRDDLKANGFTYLRLTPASRRLNPDTSAAFVKEAISEGPDIDGVAARYVE